jgi:Tol biopolymer transport system component
VRWKISTVALAAALATMAVAGTVLAPSVTVAVAAGVAPGERCVSAGDGCPAPSGHRARSDDRPRVWVRYDPARHSAGLVVGNVHGRHQRRLTRPGSGVLDNGPVRSPDGTRVLFDREYADGTVRIGLVAVRGGPIRFIDTGCVDPCFTDHGPGWSPDGRRLSFVRVMGPFDPVTGDAASALQYTERLDGSDLKLLSVPGDYEDNGVRFAPGGRFLLLIRDQRIDGVLHFAIFRMRSDSTRVRQLTPWDLDADRASVSPDRSGPTAGLVAFETHGGGSATQGDVALLPASCRTIAACTRATRYVTHNTGTTRTSYAASWSPDGRRLAFAQEDGANVDIYTIGPDGHDRRPVTRSPVPEYSPAWSQ